MGAEAPNAGEVPVPWGVRAVVLVYQDRPLGAQNLLDLTIFDQV